MSTAEPGPNGCVCGHNGDCNCPFVPSAASDATSLAKPAKGTDWRAVARQYFDALKRISKDYMTPEQLCRAVERRGNVHFGLLPDEAISMSYENIQGEAARAIAGRRRP